ncbi:solute carrier family 35 member G2 [Platysternon megacephalum]|uniref:Sulfotransferase n=1 Tax=Platysternon megacephalum TaxID=55544 RepID=A0A4D9EIQ8_9SAUR|nr:solute carrier family 35 member G2 [Platysternon megacephalum]
MYRLAKQQLSRYKKAADPYLTESRGIYQIGRRILSFNTWVYKIIARSDDVILAGYPKSGTNWLDQVLNDLEITAAKYTEEEINERINITNELSVFLRLEYGDPEKFKVSTG